MNLDEAKQLARDAGDHRYVRAVNPLYWLDVAPKRYPVQFRVSMLGSSCLCLLAMIVFMATQWGVLFPAAGYLFSFQRGNEDLYIGSDVTNWMTLHSQGLDKKIFLDENHTDTNDGLFVLKNFGMNAVRVVLYAYPEYYGDLQDAIKVTNWARGKGMKVFLEIALSDVATNETFQPKPIRWKKLTGKKLSSKLYDYTKGVMKRLKNSDAIPDIVSIGNEVQNGILFDDGRDTMDKTCANNGGFIGSEKCLLHNAGFAAHLLRTGIRAIRSVTHTPRIMVHTSLGQELSKGETGADNIINFYSTLLEKHHVKFDIIGLSMYPMKATNGLKISRLKELHFVKEYFNNKFEVMLSATSWPNAQRKGSPLPTQEFDISEVGQMKYAQSLMDWIRKDEDDTISGVFWRPAFEPNATKAEQWIGPLISDDFKPLPVLKCGFKVATSDSNDPCFRKDR